MGTLLGAFDDKTVAEALSSFTSMRSGGSSVSLTSPMLREYYQAGDMSCLTGCLSALLAIYPMLEGMTTSLESDMHVPPCLDRYV